MVNRRVFLYGSIVALTVPLTVVAQHGAKTPRVGILFLGFPTTAEPSPTA